MPDAIGTPEIRERHAGDVGGRPDRDLGIAVLARDVRVDGAGVDTVVLGQEHPEARRVEDRPRADDSA